MRRSLGKRISLDKYKHVTGTFVAGTLLAIFLLITGVFYFETPSSYALHLANARSALSQLEMLLRGRPTVIWLPSVYAEEDGVFIDESAVAALAEKVVKETESAIEKVEEITDPHAIIVALEEVSDVQSDTIDILGEASDIVVTGAATEAVTIALLATSLAQKGVEEVLDATQDALSDGKRIVSFDVMTSADGASIQISEQLNDEAVFAQLETTETALENMIASGYGSEAEITKIQENILRIELAVEEGKPGRALGLCTAMQAKIRNIIRQAEKAEENSEAPEAEISIAPQTPKVIKTIQKSEEKVKKAEEKAAEKTEKAEKKKDKKE